MYTCDLSSSIGRGYKFEEEEEHSTNQAVRDRDLP